MSEKIKKIRDFFRNATIGASVAENPAVMTAAGWHQDKDGSWKQELTDADRLLADNLASIGNAGLIGLTLGAGAADALYTPAKTGMELMGHVFTPSSYVRLFSQLPRVGLNVSKVMPFAKTIADPLVHSGFMAGAIDRLGRKVINGTAGNEPVQDALDATMLVGPAAAVTSKGLNYLNYFKPFAAKYPELFYGKVKYYGPTMGKTTAAKGNALLVDFDDVIREKIAELARAKGVTPRDLKINSDPDYAKLIEEEVLRWRLDPANNGKTLMISNKVLSNPDNIKFAYDNEPSIPSKEVFIQRQVNRGEGTEQEAAEYYDALIRENPNLKIDNRFVSLIENPWAIKDLPGYQLKGFMRGNPLEKQLSKEGTISLNSLRAHTAKLNELTKNIVDQVLAEDFAGLSKIDYNLLRLAILKRLINYDRTPATIYEDYGADRLGINLRLSSRNRILAEFLAAKNNPVFKEKFLPNVDGTYTNKLTGEKVSFDEMKLFLLEDFERRFGTNSNAVDFNTFTLSSPKIPRGSDNHYDFSTLGHLRTYTTHENPEILHVMESLSDWGQDKLPAGKGFSLRTNSLGNTNIVLNPKNKKYELVGEGEGLPYEDMVPNNNELPKERFPLHLAKIDWLNKYGLLAEYLHNNYLLRQLLEALKYAAEQGQTKMRYPTPETAAKIEGYQPSLLYEDPEVLEKIRALEGKKYGKDESFLSEIKNKYPEIYKRFNEGKLRVRDWEYRHEEPAEPDIYYDLMLGADTEYWNLPEFKAIDKEIENLKNSKTIKKYSSDQTTILNKYAHFPKMFEKLYGKGTVRTVTDSKGNTWYEVDVPYDFLNKEWLYKFGGKLNYLNYYK